MLQVEDALSGKSGDSYFVAMLASLVSQPDRIKSLFVYPIKQINDCGIYLIQMYINGRLRPVIIDDYIPVEEETGEPIFCKSKNM